MKSVAMILLILGAALTVKAADLPGETKERVEFRLWQLGHYKAGVPQKGQLRYEGKDFRGFKIYSFGSRKDYVFFSGVDALFDGSPDNEEEVVCLWKLICPKCRFDQAVRHMWFWWPLTKDKCILPPPIP